MRIMIEDGAAMFELKWAGKPKYRQPQTERIRIPKGRWVNLKARLHLSESADGRVQLWQDGKKMIDEQGQTLPLTGAVYDSLEIGISATALARTRPRSTSMTWRSPTSLSTDVLATEQARKTSQEGANQWQLSYRSQPSSKRLGNRRS